MQTEAVNIHMNHIVLIVACLPHITLVIGNDVIELEFDSIPIKTGYILYGNKTK